MATAIYTNKQLSDLSAMFSSSGLERLITKKHTSHLKNIARRYGLKPNWKSNAKVSDTFEWVYHILLEQYRSEYVYKNIIANKLLRARHSLFQSVLLTEFEVGNSKADIAVFNGTSTVYEIKTELDNIDKLKKQLDAYLLVFDKIYLVTYKQLAYKILTQLDPRVGVIVLLSNYQLRTYRDATSNKANVSPTSVMSCMRRAEYIWSVEQVYGPLPSMPNTQIFRTCRSLFEKIDPSIAHDLMVSAILNHRKISESQLDLVHIVPESMKMLMLFRALNEKECLAISDSLICTLNI